MRWNKTLTLITPILIASISVPAQFVTVTDHHVLVVDSFAETFVIGGITANVNIATQDALTTFRDYQYVGWFNADHRLCLARRKNTDTIWEKIIFTDYLKTSEDAHNGISIGICANDGTIHLSFDHHNDPLHYKVSVPGLATQPGSIAWDTSSFSGVRDYMVPGQPITNMLTYPRFVPTPDGNLQFFYRLGHSGNGDSRIVFYDGHASQWTADKEFISRQGNYSDTLMGLSTARSQYHNHIMYDHHGTLYTSFTWREISQGSGTRYNHDIGYLFSEDKGATWLNSHYEVVADTAAGLSAHLYSPGINVVDVPPAYRMINNQGHAVDPRGGVHVIMHHTDDPMPTYGFAGTATYRHHWRNAQGIWRTTTLPYQGSRPKLLCDRFGNLFLIFTFWGELYIVSSSPADDYTEWHTLFKKSFSINRFNVDSHRLYDHNMLSILGHVHPDTPGNPTPLFVVDFELDYTYCCHDTVAACDASTFPMYPVDDTYVRDGSFANDTFGSLPTLEVASMQNNPGENRIIFFRFRLSDLHSREWLSGARLRVYVEQAASADVKNQQYNLHYCAGDFWHEGVTTFNFLRPQFTDFLASRPGTVDSMEWDLGPSMLDTILQKNWFTLAIEAESPAEALLTFHSKESPMEQFWPRLVLTYSKNYIRAVEDAYVGDGIYANANFGQNDHLAVQNQPGSDLNRMAFLKFDLQSIQQYPVDRAWLQVNMKAMSQRGHTAPYAAYMVANNSWSENTITWNNMPGIDSNALDGHFGRNTMHWEVTSAYEQAVQNGTALSIAIAGLLQDMDRNLLLYSKEHPDTALHPRLIIHLKSDTAIFTSTHWPEEVLNPDDPYHLMVFPNPASTQVTMQWSRPISGTLQIFSVSGALIGTFPVSMADRIQIPLSGLPYGLYLVRISSATGQLQATGKFVHQ